MLFLLVCVADVYAYTALKTGTYALSGINLDGSSHYHGDVTIAEQGNTYNLRWKIGRNQTQAGVGILTGNVLSVAYQDGSGRDMGVVAFEVVGDGHLEGRWASLSSPHQGRETLLWKISWKEE